jgi:hypothetical protein
MLESRRMSEPLRIPDDKRAGSGRGSLFDTPREHPWSFWTIVIVIVVLNGWYDYYHPRGILFDIVLIVIWAVSAHKSRNK